MNRLLLAGICLIVATSCTKKPQLKEDDDGPVAESVDVNKALVLAWGQDADPASIRKNEFVYLESTQKIQDLDPQLYQQDGITVTEREYSDDGADIIFTLAHQTQEVSSKGESKSSTVEEHVSVPNSENLSMKVMALVQNAGNQQGSDETVHQTALGVQTVAALLDICLKTDARDVSCHNLKVTEELQAAPPLIAARPGCEGLANCQIHVRKVAFDYIFSDKDSTTGATTKNKVQFNLSMSPDVPYLSRLMDYCYRGLFLAPAAGQKVLLQVCSTVKDFNVGTLPTSATTGSN